MVSLKPSIRAGQIGAKTAPEMRAASQVLSSRRAEQSAITPLNLQ
jgi:hypothetical protein